jgi:hypothetical protein
MRRPFFRRPYLEELEDRTLTNMPFGQIGTPVVGWPSMNVDGAALEESSLIALSERLQRRNG